MWWKLLFGIAILATPLIIFWLLLRPKKLPKSVDNNHERGYSTEAGSGGDGDVTGSGHNS